MGYGKRWEIERLFGNLKESYSIDNHRVKGLSRKFFNVSFKLLLFTIEKAIAILKIIQYFCNSLMAKKQKLSPGREIALNILFEN